QSAQSQSSQPQSSQPQSSQPMFFAACAFALGICLDTYLYQPVTHWFTYVLLIAGTAIWATSKRATLGLAAALLLFIPLGAACNQLDGILTDPPPDISAFTDSPVTVIAHVTQA